MASTYSISARVNVHGAGVVNVYVLQGGSVVALQTYNGNDHTFTFTGLTTGTYTVVVHVGATSQQTKTGIVPPNAQVTFSF